MPWLSSFVGWEKRKVMIFAISVLDLVSVHKSLMLTIPLILLCGCGCVGVCVWVGEGRGAENIQNRGFCVAKQRFSKSLRKIRSKSLSIWLPNVP